MNLDKIRYFVGNSNILGKALPIFSDTVCDFLGELSTALRKDPEVKNYPDIITFAFWIRMANLQKYKQKYIEKGFRLGKGMVFHIAPSNVPINFAFSLVFGLLAGNSNVVRVSSKEFAQTRIVCKNIERVLETEKYPQVKENITILSYPHDAEITNYFSGLCSMRVIWGGDATIAEIRKSELSPRASDITFADRYSFSILDAKAIEELEESGLKKLADAFFNDTYLIDQNACSSPHLLIWKLGDIKAEHLSFIQNKFWKAIAESAQKWEIKDIHASEKYLLACEYSIQYPEIKKLHRYSNRLYVMDLENLSVQTQQIRGKFGLFSQMEIEDYRKLLPVMQKNTQTITYFGISPEELVRFIVEQGVEGVDRIVPFGKSLELDLIWDGYDIIDSLSRIIGWHSSVK